MTLSQIGPSTARGRRLDFSAAAWRMIVLLLNTLVWVEVLGLAHLVLRG